MGVRPGSAARPREKAHLFQEVSRGLNSLSIRVVQSVDVESVEIAEYTMHPVALFVLLVHRKRLTARRRRKTPPSRLASGLEEVTTLTNEPRGVRAGCWLTDAQRWRYSRLGP